MTKPEYRSMSAVKVAVLGTGLMGYGMAQNINKSGFHTTVWNRTKEKAAPLAEEGISVAPDIASAVKDADVVLTMVIDADAVSAVMAHALTVMKKDAIWLQSSTVGLDGTLALAEMAKRYDIAFFDAPVLGSKDAADSASLIVLAAGKTDYETILNPIFDAIGSRTMWMGDNPNDAQRLKMVMQSWALSITSAVGQAFALAKNLQIDPNRFLEAIKGGAQDCPYAHMKGEAMEREEFPPAFTVDGAIKDAGLILEAMEKSMTSIQLMASVESMYRFTANTYSGREDMGAIYRTFKSEASK